MPGPDLRIAMPQTGAPRMGPPTFNPGAPVVSPHIPTTGPNVQTMTPGQQAARAVDYNSLRGYIPQPGTLACKGCGPDGPSLGDIAPLGLLNKIPMWAKVVGGVAATGGLVALIVWLVRR